MSSVLFSNIERLAFGNIAETPYEVEESDLFDFHISIDKKKVSILFKSTADSERVSFGLCGNVLQGL